MQVLDSSSALHAWDNYPIEQFPPLWAWLAQRVTLSELSISEVALKEVRTSHSSVRHGSKSSRFGCCRLSKPS